MFVHVLNLQLITFLFTIYTSIWFHFKAMKNLKNLHNIADFSKIYIYIYIYIYKYKQE